jgi:hypothetical protein
MWGCAEMISNDVTSQTLCLANVIQRSLSYNVNPGLINHGLLIGGVLLQ